MSAHTEGRLVVAEIYPGRPTLIVDCGDKDWKYSLLTSAIAAFKLPADARRLAACWNACEGFETDAIENILVVGDTFKARFGMLQAEHRETLAELAELRAILDRDLRSEIGKGLDMVAEAARGLVRVADDYGVVLTVTQRPLLPLAMGNYETVVEVRESRATYQAREAAERAAAEKGGAK